MVSEGKSIQLPDIQRSVVKKMDKNQHSFQKNVPITPMLLVKINNISKNSKWMR